MSVVRSHGRVEPGGAHAGMGVKLRKATVLSRGNVQVVLPGGQGIVAGALLAAKGGIVTRRDLIDLIWGDDAGGGPEFAPGVLAVWMCKLRPEFARLGLRVVNEGYRGWFLESVIEAAQRSADCLITQTPEGVSA